MAVAHPGGGCYDARASASEFLFISRSCDSSASGGDCVSIERECAGHVETVENLRPTFLRIVHNSLKKQVFTLLRRVWISDGAFGAQVRKTARGL
jgi:hypothetical protein